MSDCFDSAETRRNIALILRYDGTRFHGWQRQRNAVTVQGTLENAIAEVTGEAVSVIGCGRTDAGVHAEYYVANFRSSCAIPADRLPFALNSRLPDDISVQRAREVPWNFHAVFDCEQKEYTYRIHSAAVRDPLLNNRSWWYPHTLDTGAMIRGSAEFIGTHDFSAMRTVGTNVKSTVRTIFSFDIFKNCDIINLRVVADGFLYNMVRAMVGTLVYVGIGKIQPTEIAEILKSEKRSLAGPTAPPQGLYMTNAVYSVRL
ncbi:MAG: tRNA pseudouridine(38-40) synthase TruA [Oscillospiraceae bacterium]|jgi:tRNA pseudouridine38-40 synthase|nr:tRNA pseudouridine(38-40) synthase TruA [Oscillospiraceae bacterium]